jgi:DNA-binding NarL/FixJ family response regulator
VLIADDHEVVRRGLREILHEAYDDIEIMEAGNSDEALDVLAGDSCDLLLLDIVMPSMPTIDLIELIEKRHPDTRILVLTAIEEIEYAVRAIRSGASGFISKHQASSDLLLALKQVLAGGTYLSAEAMRMLSGSDGRTSAAHESLSQRELAVLCSIASGRAIKEIAFDMNVSSKTVATYVTRIKEKTGLQSYVDMTRYALLHRLVE